MKNIMKFLLSEFTTHVAAMSDDDVWASIQKAEKLTAGCVSEEEYKDTSATTQYAQVGDYVKIVKSLSPLNRFEVGKIYKVVQLLSDGDWNIPGCVNLDCGGIYAKPSEYVVIKNYQEK